MIGHIHKSPSGHSIRVKITLHSLIDSTVSPTQKPARALTLFEEFSRSMHPEQYAVTNPLEKLIQVIAQDASLMSRNIHSAYTAIAIARLGLDEIKALIKNVGNEDPSAATWENFQRYATLIPIVEKFCLSLQRISHTESHATLSSHPLDVYFEQWEASRERLRTLVEQISKDLWEFKILPVFDDWVYIQRYDDCQVFITIVIASNFEPIPVGNSATKVIMEKIVANVKGLRLSLFRAAQAVFS
ncbi:unnamed protein product [Mycena citricolor]|uniref:Uncharacterized protein n=1 Tax=Mycena citricolor TaxID=2018698 RepID=A0AAD2Q5H9_9AGAR|nr:unnamed protein product [Mycena citricolor]